MSLGHTTEAVQNTVVTAAAATDTSATSSSSTWYGRIMSDLSSAVSDISTSISATAQSIFSIDTYQKIGSAISLGVISVMMDVFGVNMSLPSASGSQISLSGILRDRATSELSAVVTNVSSRVTGTIESIGSNVSGQITAAGSAATEQFATALTAASARASTRV